MVNPINNAFPVYSAAAAQVAEHGRRGALFMKDAALSGGTKEQRLELVLRGHNAFDHAITASRALPLTALPGVSQYLKGYDAAKAATNTLIISGKVPASREIFGKAEILAAREEFNAGIALTGGQTGAALATHDRLRALDFLDASIEDTTNGLLMLRKPVVAVPLLAGLKTAREAVAGRVAMPAGMPSIVDGLFAKAAEGLDAQIVAATRGKWAATPPAAS